MIIKSYRPVSINGAWLQRGIAGVLVALLFMGSGCKSTYDAAYYRTMEAFGKEKRDLLVDRVEDARESQEDAQEQFASALEQFSALVGYDGGDLEALYKRLETEFDRSQKRAEAVSDHIEEVADVAEALFKEWEAELESYSDPELRQASERQLRDTRARFEELIQAMYQVERKMDPVLAAFQDQVLFLKHNLNARAITSLEDNVVALETDVNQLIGEMEASIDEANRFIEEMRS
jgi:hypothetical protein